MPVTYVGLVPWALYLSKSAETRFRRFEPVILYHTSCYADAQFLDILTVSYLSSDHLPFQGRARKESLQTEGRDRYRHVCAVQALYTYEPLGKCVHRKINRPTKPNPKKEISFQMPTAASVRRSRHQHRRQDLLSTPVLRQALTMLATTERGHVSTLTPHTD